jgi:predicted nucleic acid-binding protein
MKDVGVHAFLTAAVRLGSRVLIPTVVLTEVVTGKPSDAQIWHVVNRLVTEDLTRDVAGHAGAIRQEVEAVRAKKKDLTVDAIVAAVARHHTPSLVLTSDVRDLTLLCSGADITVCHPRDVL